MASTKILDRTQKIIEIVWDAQTTPEEMDRITAQISQFSKQLGGSFDVLVDMQTVKVFKPETQARLVEHQISLKNSGMQRAAVVIGSVITKMQLNRTSKAAEHSTETQWETYEEALSYLRK